MLVQHFSLPGRQAEVIRAFTLLGKAILYLTLTVS